MSYDPHTPPPVPPPLEPPLSAAGMTEKSGLPRNIAASLACILPLFGGLYFYMTDRRDRFVRHYALQSIVLGTVFFVLGVVLRMAGAVLQFIPLLGRVFLKVLDLGSMGLGVIFAVLWLGLIYNAYRGRTWVMPVVWNQAKRHIPQALL